jgi:PhnB protein
MHAQLKIGDSRIMLGEENRQMGVLSPKSAGGNPVLLYVYTPDVDGVVKKAVNAGAKLERPVQDMFYGDRAGSVTDPFGYKWFVATHVEDVAPEELRKRAAAQGGANNSTQDIREETHRSDGRLRRRAGERNF